MKKPLEESGDTKRYSINLRKASVCRNLNVERGFGRELGVLVKNELQEREVSKADVIKLE